MCGPPDRPCACMHLLSAERRGGLSDVCGNASHNNDTARLTELQSILSRVGKCIASQENDVGNTVTVSAALDFAEVHPGFNPCMPKILVESSKIEKDPFASILASGVSDQGLSGAFAQHNRHSPGNAFLKPPHRQHKSKLSISSNGTSQQTISDGSPKPDEIIDNLSLFLSHLYNPKQGLTPEAYVDSGNAAHAPLLANDFAIGLGWQPSESFEKFGIPQCDGSPIIILGVITLMTRFDAPNCKGFRRNKIKFWVVDGKDIHTDCILNQKLIMLYEDIWEHATRRRKDHTGCRHL